MLPERLGRLVPYREPVRQWEIQLNRLPDGGGIEALLMDERHPLKVFEPEIDIAAALHNVINELELRDYSEFAHKMADRDRAKGKGR